MGRFPHEPRLHSSSSKYLKVSLLQVNWCVRALTGNQLLCSKNIKSWKKKCKKRITTKNNLVQLGENMWKVTITHDCSWFLPLSRYCKLPQMIPHRKWSPEWTANDDPRPQVIPIVDRKWSREENQNGLDSSYWIIVSRLLSQQKVLEGHVHGSAHAHLLKCCFSAWHAVSSMQAIWSCHNVQCCQRNTLWDRWDTCEWDY